MSPAAKTSGAEVRRSGVDAHVTPRVGLDALRLTAPDRASPPRWLFAVAGLGLGLLLPRITAAPTVASAAWPRR